MDASFSAMPSRRRISSIRRAVSTFLAWIHPMAREGFLIPSGITPWGGEKWPGVSQHDRHALRQLLRPQNVRASRPGDRRMIPMPWTKTKPLPSSNSRWKTTLVGYEPFGH